MVAVPLGLSDYARDVAKTWPVFLENMFIEKDPTNQVDGMVRVQRPALASFQTFAGDGASRGVYRHAGVFFGDYLAAFHDALYRVQPGGFQTYLGALNDAHTPVVIAATKTRALIATGGPCYSTDGVAVTQVNMPSGAPVSSVAVMDGYFILPITGSPRFFWIAPGETDPNAFNFASVENAPGDIVMVVRLQDELWFFKEQSIEVWQATGNQDAPFVRIGGRLFERGCCNRDTVFVLDNTVFWAGDDFILYRAGASPQRFSDHAMEERMRKAGKAALSGFAYSLDGHTFYALKIQNTGTYLFDVESGSSFAHWFSFHQKTWRAVNAAQDGSQVIVGDDATRTLWRLDPAKNRDEGDVPIPRAVYGVLPVVGAPVTCDCVRIVAATGRVESPTAEPHMELNFIDDQISDFEFPWYPISLGKQGDYSIITEARQLGVINPPGRLFALRCTDNVPFRISYARMNED